MYRALLLDFAGVMTGNLGASWDVFSAREGLAPGAWRRIIEHHPTGRRLYADLERGAITQTEWNHRTGALLGLDNPTNLMGRAHAYVQPAPEMHAVVRTIRATGITVALLSNSYGTEPYNPYETLGVWELCDVHVISGDEGVAKPDPEIYRRALTRLGLPASACVFVDDHARNLAPAARLGITIVHATTPGAAADSLAALFGITRWGIPA